MSRSLYMHEQRSRSFWRVSAHIFLITASNVLVQYPFVVFGLHTTWGAFTYPAIFLLTDLTTRLYGAQCARHTVFQAMLPGLVVSYVVTCLLAEPQKGWGVFTVLQTVPLRIALACFVAYIVGQLTDILLFSRLRAVSGWWWAPMVSTTIGSVLDTLVFFSLAFYASSNAFMAAHWPEIAFVDMVFKIGMSLLAIVPLYGLFMSRMQRVASV